MRTWKQYLCRDEWGGEKGGYGKPQGSKTGWQLFPDREMKDKNSKLVKLGKKQEMQMQRQQGLGGSGGGSLGGSEGQGGCVSPWMTRAKDAQVGALLWLSFPVREQVNSQLIR